MFDSLQSFVVSADIITVVATDHSAITLKINSLPYAKSGPSYWRLNSSLLEDVVYINELTKVIEDLCNENICLGHNMQKMWDYIKFKVKEYSIVYSKNKARCNREEITNLENTVTELENKLNSNTAQLEEYKQAKAKLENKYEKITEGIIIRSRTQWYESGEKCNKYFLNLEKKQK